MASQGPLSPGTLANDAAVGSFAWSNPSNAAASDNSRASVEIDGSPSNYLKATNFGFTIPGGATIDGIVVEIERRYTGSGGGADANDSEVKIVKANGSIGSTNKATADAWPAGDAYASYGGASDLWSESWTSADINDADFGVVISAFVGGSNEVIEIDHIRITVHYTADPNTRYWVGGTGNWSDNTNHWSDTSGGSPGASKPASTNNAIFDGNSGTGTVTVDEAASCLNLDFSGYTGTFAGSSALSIYGSLTLGSGMTRTYTGQIAFLATSTGKTITSNGILLRSNCDFNGVGGGWTFQDTFDNTDGGAQSNGISLVNGSISTNGMTMTWGQFSTNTSTTRVLTLGASTLNVRARWEMENTTNLTFSGASSTINIGAGSASPEFKGGGLTYGSVILIGNGKALSITGSNTITTLTLTQGSTVTFTAGTTQSVTNFSPAGTSGNILTLKSSVNGSTWTVSKTSGVVSGDYLSLRDSTATGGATFFAGNNSTNVSNNSGWQFSASSQSPSASISPSSSASLSPSSSVSPSSSISPSASVSPSSSVSASVSPSASTSPSSSVSRSISPSASTSPSSSVSPSSSISPSASISPSSSASSSLSPSSSVSPSSSESASVSPSGSTSPSASVSPSISPSSSASASLSPSASVSPSSSLSPSASPSAGYSLYSRGDYLTLPTNDDDLEILYTDAEEIKVSSNNGIRVGQTGTLQYMIHEFKNFVADSPYCTVEFEGRTTLAPADSTVYLQIYNQVTDTWETIASNTTYPDDLDFQLIGTVRDLTNYRTSNKLISCRVYQLGI